jgi:rhodanese-related sulfurtransferase
MSRVSAPKDLGGSRTRWGVLTVGNRVVPVVATGPQGRNPLAALGLVAASFVARLSGVENLGASPGNLTAVEGSHEVVRSMKPEAAWGAVQLGFAEILDLRTGIERRRHGAPPGARPVSLAKHIASPEGPGAIYLCQHALRSKATLRHGAAEIAGGFAAWKKAGLPVEEVELAGPRE